MAQQTAVEWFCNKLSDLDTRPRETLQILEWYEQAKQMEKEQIIQFGKKIADHWGMTEVPLEYIEQYYNENYGK